MNKKATYICFDKKKNYFIETTLIENENGINPIVKENINYFERLPLLENQLKIGNEIYICFGNAYLGGFHTEGPYGEEKVFLSEYDSHSYDDEELLIGLNKAIKQEERNPKKLIKIGKYYETSNN